MHDNKQKIIQLAQNILNQEAQAILGLVERIDDGFIKACEYLLSCKSRVIVTGIGKSGHIANKIAATLASTGTPAFFMHPVEAIHGDIGAITNKDVVIAISKSGEAEEILAMLPLIKLLGVPLITITGKKNSKLSKLANINLDISVKKEACLLDLAPTCSTTATLAIGDALAISVFKLRGFTADDFARLHPGGVLGKRLLLTVNDIMHKGNDIPKTNKNRLLQEALVEMTHKRMGMTVVINDDGSLAGVFTDGDLRRSLDKNLNIHTTKLSAIMTRNCKTITAETLAAEAVRIMEQHQIMALVVIDKNNMPIGAVHMHDLLKTGL